MKPEDLNWRSGKVVFWDLGALDDSKPPREQLEELKEDLAQVSFPRGVVLDVGWYPEFLADGAFVIRVVRETDWEDAIFIEHQPDIDGLLASLSRAVPIADAVASGAGDAGC